MLLPEASSTSRGLFEEPGSLEELATGAGVFLFLFWELRSSEDFATGAGAQLCALSRKTLVTVSMCSKT